MHKSLFGLAISLSTIMFSSCSAAPERENEELVRSAIAGSTDAPEWVKGRIDSNTGSISFVGRGGAFNVLDERKAFDEAFMHARQQLAEYVGTRVQAELCDKDWAVGARYLGLASTSIAVDDARRSESPDQAIASRTWQYADAIVGQLLPVDQHWEQWEVRSPARITMQRYKCWLLTSISTSAVDNFVTATLRRLENDAKVARLEAEKDELERAGVAHSAALAASEAERRADAQELQMLRERVHYGRAFRLTATDNCPVDDHCVPLDRSNWRRPAEITPIVIRPPAPAAPAPAPDACCELPMAGGR
jgi:hypothetical protein